MLHDDLAFMGPVVWLLATNGRGATRVDSEFKVKDRVLDAGFVEAVPMTLNDSDDRSFDNRVMIPAVVNVSFGVTHGERLGWMAECLAVLLKFEDVVVDIITVIKRNITVKRFGTPNLGGDVDSKVAGRRGQRSRR
jgi:hypothetical protein